MSEVERIEVLQVPGLGQVRGGLPAPVPAVAPPRDLRREVVTQFLEAHCTATSTRRSYAQVLERFLGFLEERGFERISARLIGRYRHWLGSESGAGYQATTANRHLAVVQAFIGWHRERYPGVIAEDPFLGVRRYRQSPPVPKDFSDAEVERLRAVAVSWRDQLALELLLCGLRASEVLGATWEDLSLEEQSLRIPKAKADSTGIAPLTGRVMALLREVEPGAGPILRSQRSGEPLSYDGLRSLVARLGERAGVADVHPHRFRHTFGRWLYSSDHFSGLEAMILMRHRSLSAHDRYVRHAAQQRATERFRQLGDLSDVGSPCVKD